MNFRPDLYQGLRYSRRMGEQVPCSRYACALEIPRPSVWQRIVMAFKEMTQ